MYEVEYKVEITEAERTKLTAYFSNAEFVTKPDVNQNDYYIEAKDSPFGGKDLKRYREEGRRAFYTEKVWEDAGNGTCARRETEHEVTMEYLLAEVAKFPDAIKIKKSRRAFAGTYLGRPIHIDMDAVKFDHSSSVRFFIEAEIMAADKSEVASLKTELINFLRGVLGRQDIREAPGMFTMALKKI